jgi:hypothetical protein
MPLVETVIPKDNLEVNVGNQLLKSVTVKEGENLKRGDLVSLSTGKAIAFVTGATPYTVMAQDVDATAGDKVGVAFRRADLKASEVNFGTGTDTEVRDALDVLGIFLRD